MALLQNSKETINMSKPEYNIKNPDDGSFMADVEVAQESKRYINISISKEDLGCLLQGKHLEILFPGDELDGRGMIDIGLSDKETKFEISDEVNKFMI